MTQLVISVVHTPSIGEAGSLEAFSFRDGTAVLFLGLLSLRKCLSFCCALVLFWSKHVQEETHDFLVVASFCVGGNGLSWRCRDLSSSWVMPHPRALHEEGHMQGQKNGRAPSVLIRCAFSAGWTPGLVGAGRSVCLPKAFLCQPFCLDLLDEKGVTYYLLP